MSRLVRLLCASTVALVFALVSFAALAGPASAAQTLPVQDETVLDNHHAPALINRRYISPDIASPLVLRPNDRLIEVRGGIACTASEQFRVHVVVTQSATGAYAEGHTQGVCTGDKQVFTLLAVARGNTPFTPGAARRGRRHDLLPWPPHRHLQLAPAGDTLAVRAGFGDP